MTFDRRSFLALGGASAAFAAAGPGLAKAPPAAGQVPGLYRQKVGALEVTFVLDGGLEIPLAMFPAAEPGAAGALLEAAFQGPATATAHVVAWLVNSGERLVLIDTGGRGFAPSMGRLADNLAAAGIAADAIDAVLLTHQHVDHVNGLLDAAGGAAFPRAELVVAEAELAFWAKLAADPATPEGMQPFVAAANAATAPYRERLRPFTGEVEVAPGITAVPLPGHTPGHTGYRIASGDRQLLVWGDIVHAQALQFARPDWAIAFDVDQDAAVATRRKVLDMVATDRIPVAGAHLLFPGTGHVARAGDAYAYVPAPFTPSL